MILEQYRIFLYSLLIGLFLPFVGVSQTPFTDVTVDVGVTQPGDPLAALVHDGGNGLAPPDDPGPEDVQLTGTGAAWFDYNDDGLLDLYITMRTGANYLYENQGIGPNGITFENVATSKGITDSNGDGSGVAVADFDNDGDQDVFICNNSVDRLFQNNGFPSYTFTDITASSGLSLTNDSRTQTASWGDYDNDGFLDLYVCMHIPHPNSSNEASWSDLMYHNNGDGTFTDVTSLLNAQSIDSPGFVGAWSDYNNDGLLDLILINDCNFSPIEYEKTKVFRNDGGTDGINDWTFTEVSISAGINDCSNGMGIAVGDVDRNGFMDFAHSDIGAIHLWKNENGFFTNIANSAGIDNQLDGHYSWGTCFIDHNLDGWQDLFVVSGYLTPGSNPQDQPNYFYENDGDGNNDGFWDGTFTDLSSELEMDDNERSRNAVFGDFDNDGDTDIAIVNYGQKVMIKQNNNAENNYLKIHLIGYESNKDAIGSKVRIVTPDGKKQYFETRSGSNLGGGDQIEILAGVGTYTFVDSVVVTFPSGIVRSFNNVQANQTFLVHEYNQEAFFTDVTLEAGITAVHDGEEVTDFYDLMAGAAWLDWNNDGNLDLYIPMRNGPNYLYENNGNGTFTDIAASVNADDSNHDGGGVVIGDINNDGFRDIFLSNGDEDVLLKNVDGTSFEDISSTAGINTGDRRGTSGSWGDYNEDGFLDLYVSHHRPIDEVQYPDSAVQDFLFLNNGDETFTDVSDLLGINNLIGTGFIAGWTDFDNDGDLDIILINDCGPSTGTPIPTKIFRNDGGTNPINNWTFTEVAVSVGVDDCSNGMGIGVGDLDRNGDFDFIYTDIGEVNLYQNNSATFSNITTEAGVGGQQDGHYSWGTSFVDYDLDGWQDIVMAFGVLNEDGNEFPRPNRLWRNNGDNTFTDVSAESNMADPDKSRTIVHGDYDSDGDMDFFVANYGVAPILKRNELSNGNNWLMVKPIGTVSNRDGIGAKVRVNMNNGFTQHFEVRSGSNLGGGDQIIACFGLGIFSSVGSVEVEFLSGITTTLNNVQANQIIEVYEQFAWSGTVSSSWNDPANWNGNELPNEEINVTIPNGVPNFPVLDVDATIKSLTIESNASLIIDQGLTLTIDANFEDIIAIELSGDLTNNGSLIIQNSISGGLTVPPNESSTIINNGPLNIQNITGTAIDINPGASSFTNNDNINITNSTVGIQLNLSTSFENAQDKSISFTDISSNAITLNGGMIDNQGDILFLDNIGGQAININTGSFTNLESGRILGNGDIDANGFNSMGEISPGLSPGEISFQGNYNHNNATYAAEISGNAGAGIDGGNDLIQVNGNATLGGTLNLTLDGYSPQDNEEFFILTCAGTLTDTFDILNLPALPNDRIWDIQYNTDNVNLIIIPPAVDTDEDGIDDNEDNCPEDANTDQADNDNDGMGDVCDEDDDNDGINDVDDNCPFTSNQDQSDLDEDGEGDVCDDDDDGDGINDDDDNCPESSNPDQIDTDNDGMGDMCDEDDDNDGINDNEDNCPLDINADQADADNDGEGDVCDIDDDNDGIDDNFDNCLGVFNPNQLDTDQDGEGDACDNDDDNDGIDDDDDNCPLVENPNQEDADMNGIGDACEGDIDGDGVQDDIDNCVDTPNEDQADSDDDGMGDVCDDDDDNDSVDDEDDNCPFTSNMDQADNDMDGMGDICDEDDDNDSIADEMDNCPLMSNQDQADNDMDGQGDICDDDDDNDGINDTDDNCPLTSNEDQLDTDEDGEGDICDEDDDNDGINDENDNCPLIANMDQADSDMDGEGDVCDEDADNDGINDTDDNCPNVANMDQLDTDEDGEGDVCDDDDDNDGINDTDDNCPLAANEDQSDNDMDGEGDICDEDDDNDGINDEEDNCPSESNGNQLDTDEDGIGDVCDEDDDNDGINDVDDNCPLIANSDQLDTDDDGMGDACDEDDDNDGVNDEIDNCPLMENPDQLDSDNDGLGDVCDEEGDSDNDGVIDEDDNCPDDSNTDQLDTDEDGMGDACDEDDDNDGINDVDDNCPLAANEDQSDNDMDGEGDICDEDDDNDGVNDEIDNCPHTPNTIQEDSDNDGIGDACDDDMDNDGVPDEEDNCPETANEDQSDNDTDGIGDSCDEDDDNDGVDDEIDNCPESENSDQLDTDEDGEGDACDGDDDNDEVNDDMDNCPLDFNADQLDTDEDGEGDACDTDDDNDGIDDENDNCPLDANEDQLDTDEDGLGDICDPDDDNDGIEDNDDNCPLTFNPDQSDMDNDGEGDVCEPSSLIDELLMKVEIYPNPASDYLIIDKGDLNITQIDILSLHGQKLIEFEIDHNPVNKIDLNLKSNVYFLRIHIEQIGIAYRKLIISR